MIRRLIAPLVLLLLLAVAVPAAQAAKGLELGFQDDDVFLNHYWGSPDLTYQKARGFHARWQRVMVEWADTLPTQNRLKRAPATKRYNWAKYDQLIANAKRYGIHVELVLTGPTPAWANAKHQLVATAAYKPSATEYGKFVYSAVRHFRTQGVSRYSIWNEPNHVGYLSPISSQASLYRSLYKNGYANARKAYPSATVFFGETAPYYKAGQSQSPLAFLRGVLCVNSTYTRRDRRCPKFVADGYAQHPYDNFHRPSHPGRGRDDVTVGTIPHLTSALDKLSRLGALRKRTAGKLNVYLTEFGYFSTRITTTTVAIPESKRPAYVSSAYNIARTNPRVKQISWYQLVEPNRSSKGQYLRSWLSFIVRSNYANMPSYNLLATWANKYKSWVNK